MTKQQKKLRLVNDDHNFIKINHFISRYNLQV